MGVHYKFLNEEFSKNYITRFRELYDEMEKSGIRKEAHLKWVLRVEHFEEYYLEKFPWIADLPLFDYKAETLVFFRMNPTWPNGNMFHVHIDPLNANANINIPVYNCTNEAVTSWVKPTGDLKHQTEERAGDKIIKGETPVDFLKSEYEIIESVHITDRCCLFKGDVYHKVDLHSTEDKTRVMCKIWSRDIGWENLQQKFKDYIDEDYQV